MISRRIKAPNPEQVAETLNNSGLDKRSTLVMGSSVLAILGIEHARDVDVMIPRMVHTQLMWSGMTPSGLPLKLKPGSAHGFLQTPQVKNHFLGLDIAPAYAPEHPDLMVDNEFLEFLEPLPHFDGYPYLTLDAVRAHKLHVGTGKHRRDIKLIDTYLKSHKV